MPNKLSVFASDKREHFIVVDLGRRYHIHSKQKFIYLIPQINFLLPLNIEVDGRILDLGWTDELPQILD